MKPLSFDRRRFCRGLLASTAAQCCSFLPAAAPAAGSPNLTPVGDRLMLIDGAGGNVLVLPDDGGQLLVDSGAAGFGDALLAVLGGLPGAGRVDTVVNTHWHLDQVGGNALFGRAGARILAHEKTRLHLSTDHYLPAEDRYQPALSADAWPTESFYSEAETIFAGERIQCGYLLEAHTDGDIYVYFRDANVIAAGDALSPARDPELDWFGGGWIGGRVDALRLLLAISDAQTRFVPSYGGVVGRAELQAEYDAMLVLFERLVDLMRKGMGPEDVLAAGVMEGLNRSFDDPAKFVYDALKSLWAHHNTLSHDIV